MKKRKAIFDNYDKDSFAVKVNALSSNDFFRKPFGHQLDDLRAIVKFKEEAKTGYVGAKHKNTMAAVKKWVKLVKPTEFYARWRQDSTWWKDDSVEIFYKEAEEILP
jgi:hypothetical protein